MIFIYFIYILVFCSKRTKSVEDSDEYPHKSKHINLYENTPASSNMRANIINNAEGFVNNADNKTYYNHSQNRHGNPFKMMKKHFKVNRSSLVRVKSKSNKKTTNRIKRLRPQLERKKHIKSTKTKPSRHVTKRQIFHPFHNQMRWNRFHQHPLIQQHTPSIVHNLNRNFHHRYYPTPKSFTRNNRPVYIQNYRKSNRILPMKQKRDSQYDFFKQMHQNFERQFSNVFSMNHAMPTFPNKVRFGLHPKHRKLKTKRKIVSFNIPNHHRFKKNYSFENKNNPMTHKQGGKNNGDTFKKFKRKNTFSLKNHFLKRMQQNPTSRSNVKKKNVFQIHQKPINTSNSMTNLHLIKQLEFLDKMHRDMSYIFDKQIPENTLKNMKHATTNSKNMFLNLFNKSFNPKLKPTLNNQNNSSSEWELINNDSKQAFEPSIKSSNPCLKCPPNREVIAPRGRDCVVFRLPELPKSSCSFGIPSDLHVELTKRELPQGGILHEGFYTFNIVLMSSVPLKNCNYNYEVIVQKCPELNSISGGRVHCTAGRAWGSKCSWECEEDRKLDGVSRTACGGASHAPRWSAPPPRCVTRSTVETGCSYPKKIQGSYIRCSLMSKSNNHQGIYPLGTKCEAECKNKQEYQHKWNYNRLTQNTIENELEFWLPKKSVAFYCNKNGVWDPELPNDMCSETNRIPNHRKHLKVPRSANGECSDLDLNLGPSGVVHLIPPRFYTASGDHASVSCDLNKLTSEGTYVRTCIATDTKQEVSSKCTYSIKVSGKRNDKCLNLRAPDNGSMMCYESKYGSPECKVKCNKGFRLHPRISHGIIRCSGNLWDFQMTIYDKLPHCTWKR